MVNLPNESTPIRVSDSGMVLVDGNIAGYVDRHGGAWRATPASLRARTRDCESRDAAVAYIAETFGEWW